MKINETDQIQKQLTPVNRTEPRPSEDQGFRTIMKDQVNQNQPSTAEGAATRQTAFVNPLNGVQMKISTSSLFREALDRTEGLIDLLEQYRSKLADPALSLKQIDPIIQEIGRESENLTPILDTLPDNNDLKRVVNEALVTASMEVTKFYRGDYI
jgi:hypothetical protein